MNVSNPVLLDPSGLESYGDIALMKHSQGGVLVTSLRRSMQYTVPAQSTWADRKSAQVWHLYTYLHLKRHLETMRSCCKVSVQTIETTDNIMWICDDEEHTLDMDSGACTGGCEYVRMLLASYHAPITE